MQTIKIAESQTSRQTAVKRQAHPRQRQRHKNSLPNGGAENTKRNRRRGNIPAAAVLLVQSPACHFFLGGQGKRNARAVIALASPFARVSSLLRFPCLPLSQRGRCHGVTDEDCIVSPSSVGAALQPRHLPPPMGGKARGTEGASRKKDGRSSKMAGVHQKWRRAVQKNSATHYQKRRAVQKSGAGCSPKAKRRG